MMDYSKIIITILAVVIGIIAITMVFSDVIGKYINVSKLIDFQMKIFIITFFIFFIGLIWVR